MNKDNENLIEKFSEIKSADKNTMMSDVVGMPDEQDKEYIRRIILRYEKNNPGVIERIIQDAREEMAEASSFGNDMLETGVTEKTKTRGISSSTNRVHALELPGDLHAAIEAYIPTIFRDRKHFAWFMKNFPELRLPRRYEAREGFFKK